MAASDHLHPGQLKMFMSAREIMTNYDPHEGDRQFKGLDRLVFHGQPQTPVEREGKWGKVYMPPPTAVPETNDEMWDRKLAESKQQMRGGIYQSLQMEGVQHPIPLTHHVRQGGEKPMVGGGQHRIAAMNAIDPDRLMPVTHHENIIAAQREPGYR